MWDHVKERVLQEATFIIETKATVRRAADYFGVSKSTVHKDVTERLSEMDEELGAKVRQVLDVNLSERHIRGGLATRNKYRRLHGSRS